MLRSLVGSEMCIRDRAYIGYKDPSDDEYGSALQRSALQVRTAKMATPLSSHRTLHPRFKKTLSGLTPVVVRHSLGTRIRAVMSIGSALASQDHLEHLALTEVMEHPELMETLSLFRRTQHLRFKKMPFGLTPLTVKPSLGMWILLGMPIG